MTDIPDDFNAYNIFTDTWTNSPSNVLNIDFEIYSSLVDLENGANRWEYCNYNDPDVGFPRDCGPTTSTHSEWFSMPGGVHNIRGITSGAEFKFLDVCHTLTTDYQLVFRQTLPYLYAQDELRLNAEDPSSDNYAILDELERFRREDGRFYFRMVWPGDDTVYEWSQTSNPVSESAEGYEAINVPFTGRYWGGLEPSTSALMDGSVNHGNWFYAVGSHRLWNGGIPSYAKSDSDTGYPQQAVELYVAGVTTEEPTDDSLWLWANPNVYSGRCDEIDGVDWIGTQEECAQAAQDLGFCDTTINSQHLINDPNNPRGCWFGAGGGCCMDGNICGSLYFNSGEGGTSSRGRTSLCKVETSSDPVVTSVYKKTDCRFDYSSTARSAGDYGAHKNTPKTLEECEELCDANPECASFVVDQMGGGKCHLRTECPLVNEDCIEASSWNFINYVNEDCEASAPTSPPDDFPSGEANQQSKERIKLDAESAAREYSMVEEAVANSLLTKGFAFVGALSIVGAVMQKYLQYKNEDKYITIEQEI
eukprot:UN25850